MARTGSQSGPARPGPHLVLNSNLYLPMLYGRIVARDGSASGQEVPIRWGGLGQFKPKVAFNGETFLVGWMERERFQSGSPSVLGWSWQSSVRQLNSSGQPVMAEFWTWRFVGDPAFYYSGAEPPGLAMGGGAGRFLVLGQMIVLPNNFIWESILRTTATC